MRRDFLTSANRLFNGFTGKITAVPLEFFEDMVDFPLGSLPRAYGRPAGTLLKAIALLFGMHCKQFHVSLSYKS